MLENEDVLVLHRAGQELLLFRDRQQGVQVEAHDPGNVELAEEGQQVAAVDDHAVTGVELDHLLAGRMAVYRIGAHTGQDLPGAFHQLQLAVLLQGPEIVAAEAGPVALGGRCRPLPVTLLHPVPRSGKNGLQLAVHLAQRAAGVVEVQVRQDHVGDRLARDAGLGQLGHELVAAALQSENTDFLVVPAIPHPGIDQDAPIPVVDQQAAQIQIDAVHLVGGMLLLPHHLGHDAEHGAPVQLEAAVVEGPECPFTQIHHHLAGWRSPDRTRQA